MAKRPAKSGLAKAIVEGRKAAGLRTQDDLAEESGVSIATIKNLERGLDVDNKAGTLDKVAKAIGMTLAELFRRAGMKPPRKDLVDALARFRSSTWNTHHLAHSEEGVIQERDEQEILDDPPRQLVGAGLTDEAIARCVEMVRAARRGSMSAPSDKS